MRSLPLLLLICLLPLRAQDVATQYLKLQESYTQRVEDISTRNRKSQSELLNKFILAMVRVEQAYRDEGNLEDLIYCQKFKEKLLLDPKMPPLNEEAPEKLRDMLQTLHSKNQETLEKHQQELNQLNSMLLQTLEAYQKEFTRQGMNALAEEVLALRKLLAQNHAQVMANTQNPTPLNSNLSADPNAYPFAIEGKDYSSIRGVIPKKSLVKLDPDLLGQVKATPLGYQFVNGLLRLPANVIDQLIEDIKRNHMFSAEIAFHPDFNSEGTPTNPVILFQLGEDKDNALFSVTLEGKSIFLYLQTDTPPADRRNHRHEIGRIQSADPVHLCITYKGDELISYFNGVESLTLRNQVTGKLNWQSAPVIIGKALTHFNNGFILPFRGTLNHVYLKAGDLNSRQVASNYNRYLLLFK